jgi:type IV pilus assembly protein PilY1
MNTLRKSLAALVVATATVPSMAPAEDVDLYRGVTGGQAPNLLIILDNAANFSSNVATSCTYTDGGAPSLGNTAGGIEQCAIYNVIHGLEPNGDGSAKVNIGLMVYNAASFAGPYSCPSGKGGCLIQPIVPLTAANKTAMKTWIKSWSLNDMKANGEATGVVMHEAWAYFSGRTGPSGRNYSAMAPDAGCQKNFVVFIGNAANSAGSPGEESGYAASTQLGSEIDTNVAARTDLTTAAKDALKTTLKATITVPSGSYGTTSFSCGSYTMPNHTDSSGLYADEWARFMYKSDVYGSYDDAQNIITYTIGFLQPACKPDYPALLTSMALNGGGKFFATSDYAEISNAIRKILNEVQAVNSVFSSSSLPVSVNTQGTYLNQIFMGMFRPDAQANPRWMGNLKQYKFIYNSSTKTLQLGDANGDPAISAASTGFISPNAVSYWTKRDDNTLPDSAGGFWKNNSSGAGGAYDSPDGEVVEKGGAAQMIRLANLANDYTATAGSTTNPRKLYTYCPSGVALECVSELTNTDNAFAVENAKISAAMFGSSNTVKISSIVRTGTTATVTTNTSHGFSDGTSVTISGATQPEYNVTKNIAYVSATSFNITGLDDYPTTPTTGAYVAAVPGSTPYAVASISRAADASSQADTATVTVTTSSAHPYVENNQVAFTGATPTAYNSTFTVGPSPGTNTFTFSIPVYPKQTSANVYNAVINPYTVTISSISKNSGTATVTTAGTHGFHVNQTITIAGTGESKYDGSRVITGVPTTSSFTFSYTGNPGAIITSPAPTAVPSTTPVSIAATNIKRTGTTDSSIATVTGVTANAFANGDRLNITKASGTGTNEGAYVVSNTAITCLNATCTSFTYPITVTPSSTVTGSAIQVAIPGASANIAIGDITRSGTTATAKNITASTFTNGQTINISASGTPVATESAYIGTWNITCLDGTCTQFTFGPVTQTPTTPATGTNMTAYSATSAPDKTALINWIRGQDNVANDEKGPGGSVTVRPAIHGDVLHSRPIVINYGNNNVVAFYGSNDGIYRAVKGNQTGTDAGKELWGFIPTEFFSSFDRLRQNSPMLALEGTDMAITPTPQKKTYFADGPTGVYQKLKPDGTTDKAYIYVAMRRGGRFFYALDVTDSAAPKVLWKKTFDTADLEEMGQTWSMPKVTQIKGWTNPVLIFGAGYDPAEDSEPPAVNTMGRGIFILDAITGAVVWTAKYGATTACSGDATKANCNVADMKYAIPSDVTLVDRDYDGKIDRLYVGDMGGNIWRVDLEPRPTEITPNYWQIQRLAAVGCNTGACTTGTPRKFFYPPDVIPVGVTGASGSYDAVVISSGDREHPLYSQVSTSSHFVTNRFYMFKDIYTGKDGSARTAALVESDLFNATGTVYANQTGTSGYYFTFATGEKGVNAPLTVAGITYLGSNEATPESETSCVNLGIARGYRVNPLTGKTSVTTFDGGGLPPSPVGGLVEVDGKLVPFIIGAGGDENCNTPDCKSAVGGGKPTINVSTKRSRTYWYRTK